MKSRARSGDRRRRTLLAWQLRYMVRRRALMYCCWRSTRRAGRRDPASRIENYLGFPTGISGNELAGRAYTQAQKFGVQMLLAG